MIKPPGGRWYDDDELMADLAQAVAERDAVPPRFVEAAINCFAWRTVDVDLALLTSIPSSSDELAGVRGDPAGTRLLCFEQGDVGVEIEICKSTVRGQLYPMRSGLITVITADGPFADTRTDEMGCFAVSWP